MPQRRSLARHVVGRRAWQRGCGRDAHPPGPQASPLRRRLHRWSGRRFRRSCGGGGGGARSRNRRRWRPLLLVVTHAGLVHGDAAAFGHRNAVGGGGNDEGGIRGVPRGRREAGRRGALGCCGALEPRRCLPPLTCAAPAVRNNLSTQILDALRTATSAWPPESYMQNFIGDVHKGTSYHASGRLHESAMSGGGGRPPVLTATASRMAQLKTGASQRRHRPLSPRHAWVSRAGRRQLRTRRQRAVSASTGAELGRGSCRPHVAC